MDVKSLWTNIISVLLCVAGYLLPGLVGEIVLTMGLYAVSGAITNWMAIYMLFERVPGFYGSGVIPLRFTEFRAGIRDLVMQQFFSPAIVNKVLATTIGDGPSLADKLAERIDFDRAFDGLVDVIMQSSFGTALSLFGGANRLQTLREPFVARMRQFLRSVGDDGEVLADIAGHNSAALLERVEHIVDQRLEQMTPELVKQIMQQMIAKHLGWLVVWGGVVGALMGLGVVAIQHAF
ncbi:MAG TPA: hypothetical protein VMH83_01905 [Candidatus Acidoferrum sp.]|nr:hypothetical protein [Candidatus Acidoferrum sp.]